MRYNIVYDGKNRIRVRLGDYAFSEKKAYGIENTFGKSDFVTNVKANFRSGSILVEYKDNCREYVLGFLEKTKLSEIPDGEIPASIQSDKKFQADFLSMLGKRLVTKLLPLTVRNVMTMFKALKYITKGLYSLLSCNINIAVLDAASIGVSVFSGNHTTGSSIMFLLGLSELLEDYTRRRAKLALSEQLALNVDTVWVSKNGKKQLIPYKSVQVGDVVIVNSGCMIPFDGKVCGGDALVNQSVMTGESEPVRKETDDTVFAGTVCEAGNIQVCVTSLAENSRLQNIIDMIDASENLKAGIQSKAENLADGIVPYSFIGFALAWLITGNRQRAISVLMVDFSCAIKLSTPISVISAMREAAEYGAAVKGGKYLEACAEADTVVFDKTGTLTNAAPKVIDVVPFGDFKRDYVLKTAACPEEHFPHSVATAVVNLAHNENLCHEEEHAEVEYLVAHGIVTKLNDERAVIGSAHFIFEDEGVEITKEERKIIDEKSLGNSSIFLAIGGKLAGMLVIDDPVRGEAAETIKKLRELGIKRICMLTGDAEAAAKRAAQQLGIDEYVSQVLPEDKSEFISELHKKGAKVIMVGDGINDAPALAAADASIAMSDGSDIAQEVADITLHSNDLCELVKLRELSRKLMQRISENYRFIVCFNASLIFLGVAGAITPTLSALLHNGSTIFISAKSMTKLL